VNAMHCRVWVGALWLAAGCMTPGPTLRVGQGPRSARIRWLRARALEDVRGWYAGTSRHVAANHEAADRFFEEDDVRGAQAAYRRIIGWYQAGPHRRVAEFWIAYCHEALGERDAAVRMYRTVARTAPEDGDLWAEESARRLALLTQPPP